MLHDYFMALTSIATTDSVQRLSLLTDSNGAYNLNSKVTYKNVFFAVRDA